jgi:chromosome segregation ATPase
VSNIDRIAPSETNFIVESKEDKYKRKLAELQEVNELLTKELEELKVVLHATRNERDMWKQSKRVFEEELNQIRTALHRKRMEPTFLQEALKRGNEAQAKIMEDIQNPPEEQEWEFP